jgi:hypothetical protein
MGGKERLYHAVTQYENSIGNVSCNCQVVGDEEAGETDLALQIDDQIENLGLHRNIECADRFVKDDEFGPGGEGSGDGDALPLSARQFCGNRSAKSLGSPTSSESLMS